MSSAINIASLASAGTAGLFFVRGTSKVAGDLFTESPEPPWNIYTAYPPKSPIAKATKSAKGDKARAIAVAGQGVNVFKNLANSGLESASFAKSVVQAIDKTAKLGSALGYLSKGVQVASNNVNPFLCGAAAYRVLAADDKQTAFKREGMSMAGMFTAEAAMKKIRGSQFMKTLRASVEKSKSPHAKVALAIVEGVTFVAGSIAGFDAGAKISESLLDLKKYN